mmetsp:Transcript_15629/g.34466  ORF Transcript_15629/g.34466 Transcript_15629/m.34466 type:complete len:93 (-) Transcript_15629:185-463(-)
MIMTPAIAFLLCYAAIRKTSLGSAPELTLDTTAAVAIIVTCTPTADFLSVMAELAAGAQARQVLAAVIFAMYCVAPFSGTIWVAAVSWLQRQ